MIGGPGADLIWATAEFSRRVARESRRERYSRVQDSKAETLLVGGDLDFATPPQNATRELLPHLPNGHQVVLREPRPHGRLLDVRARGEHAPDQHVPRTGRVDTSRYTPRPVDFTPGTTQGAIAEIVLGTMLGFAVLTVLSLALMAAASAGAGVRPQVECRAAPRLPVRARARRLVRRACWSCWSRCRRCRSTTSCSPRSRSACRSGSGSTARGSTADCRPGEDRRPVRRHRRRAHRRRARLPCDGRAVRGGDDDHRRGGRREPRGDRRSTSPGRRMPSRGRGAASRRWRPPTGDRRDRGRSAAATPVSRVGGLHDRPAGALRLREPSRPSPPDVV